MTRVSRFRQISRDPLADPASNLLPRGNKFGGSGGKIRTKPAEMKIGPNLYDYVFDDPINRIDPLGLYSNGGPDQPGMPITGGGNSDIGPGSCPCGAGQKLVPMYEHLGYTSWSSCVQAVFDSQFSQNLPWWAQVGGGWAAVKAPPWVAAALAAIMSADAAYAADTCSGSACE